MMKKVVIGLVVIASLMMMVGCSKKEEVKVVSDHTHVWECEGYSIDGIQYTDFWCSECGCRCTIKDCCESHKVVTESYFVDGVECKDSWCESCGFMVSCHVK